jgi:hypothetical protein
VRSLTLSRILERGPPTDRRVKLVVLMPTGERTRQAMVGTLFDPPLDLLELDREDLEALRDAISRLPLRGPS